MINIPKGTKDVLPSEAYKWHFVENTARRIAALYNLKEIRTPVFEHTELFLRGVGDTTDIVNKEMYTFNDKGGRSITLKPEGTAGAVRAFIENGLASGVLPLKMYYITPVFRYERPQAGRLREHHQFGVEIFGGKGAETDAEVILLARDYIASLGVQGTELQINSIGCKHCRPKYNEALREYLRPHLGEMCETCRSRFDKNPLRILDCKEEACRTINEGAPDPADYLCEECAEHFRNLKEILDACGVAYRQNPRLVRGLDYYSKTVFEFVSTQIGAQGTVLAGGRYDTLIENLGGPSVPAVGFGSGIERMLLVLENTGAKIPEEPPLKVYAAGLDDAGRRAAYALAADLRAAGISADFDHASRSVKAQFKYAGKIGAEYVAVIGSDELARGEYTVKNMADSSSVSVRAEDIVAYFSEKA
ncbi:MAG TPA: histidine--tRNA ligase [Candidatus Borkfalkia excrementavium]|uniref:Histidine--tRNA ligase n=1 Tax=Candidatus Borkfalkia excrementavium TaxID=2838505 RepID=A0A9D1Z7L5_9FIRM|nr:histidine--tRNA ligase [Candidatus Borkfalkia excrementavium]